MGNNAMIHQKVAIFLVTNSKVKPLMFKTMSKEQGK